MGLFQGQVNQYADMLLTEGFKYLRIDIPDYQSTDWLNNSKAAVITAVSKGAKVIWGVSSNKYNNSANTITASNWPTFKQAIIDNAQWANDNGVYEFQLGNEENFHNDDTTITDAQIRENIRNLATEVKQIFTNGNISYSFGDTTVENNAWASEGKGNLDIICSNIYKGGIDDDYDMSYQSRIQNMVNVFGDNFYLTEFGPSYTSLADYSTNETTQAQALDEMLVFMKSIGLSKALYFCLFGDTFGVIKDDGTYRQQLWDLLKSNIEPEIPEIPEETFGYPIATFNLLRNDNDELQLEIILRKYNGIDIKVKEELQ